MLGIQSYTINIGCGGKVVAWRDFLLEIIVSVRLRSEGAFSRVTNLFIVTLIAGII